MGIPHNVIVVYNVNDSYVVAFRIGLVALAFIVLCSLDSLMRRLACGKLVALIHLYS